MTRMRLPVLLSALAVSLCAAGIIGVASAADPVPSFSLAVRARLHNSGQLELGILTEQGVRLPRARFVPAEVEHRQWIVSSAVDISGFETRLIARRLADQRTQVALRLEGFVVKPRRAILPSNAAPGRWYRTNAVVVEHMDGADTSEARSLLAEAAAIRAAATTPDLIGLVGWLNGEPTTIARELAKGNVVLIDFWTFGCYNCRNTLPYLTAWDEKYREHGLVILGVHRPEFAYEEDPARIGEAIVQHGIEYSVPLDTDARTWRAYRNRFWPAKYLIGPTDEAQMGVRYRHFGEGRYERTERAIRAALQAVGRDLSGVPFGVDVDS
ncbi:MAG: redoxin domain-containing protein [Chloroflexi bacterium]|nr:redoxin domain-containing protein [Chloroflexota bacterium]MYD15742.1 redoxin domain-containing protein [Chloroflexota bacterium]MYJ01864.1 redoxin domain-containing protein [Chloroflexota bacterium]